MVLMVKSVASDKQKGFPPSVRNRTVTVADRTMVVCSTTVAGVSVMLCELDQVEIFVVKTFQSGYLLKFITKNTKCRC